MSDSKITPPSSAKGEDDISDINHDKEGGDFDWMFAKLNKHLAALKLVRAPGKGKLTVGEAVEATLAQAEAYENWCRFGAPGGVIEVWVEDQRVMALHPGGATDLQGVLFEAAGMPKAVVQVVRRADEIADTVVLLNRELRDVLYKGGRCEQQHPNNRHVTLEVKREGRGQLSFWVGFNQPSKVQTGGLGILDRLKGKAARAGLCIRVRAERLKEVWSVPPLGTAAAVLALMACAGVALVAREQNGALAAAGQTEAAAETPARAAPDYAQATTLAYEVLKNGGEGVSGAARAASKQTAADAPEVDKHVMRAAAARPRLAATRINVVAPKDEPVPQGADAVALTVLSERVVAVADDEPSPWDARRLRRLAEVQSVVLKMDEATALDKERADDLLSSIKEALEGLGIVALTSETEKRTADGVMLLRFESDAILLGAIFATMRDREGDFLWEDHVGCRVMPDESGWNATFDDASARLISKLLPRMKVASNHGDEKSHPFIGSKFSRRLMRRLPAARDLVVDATRYEKGDVTMSQAVNYGPK
jgi:hypothetical protein